MNKAFNAIKSTLGNGMKAMGMGVDMGRGAYKAGGQEGLNVMLGLFDKMGAGTAAERLGAGSALAGMRGVQTGLKGGVEAGLKGSEDFYNTFMKRNGMRDAGITAATIGGTGLATATWGLY